MNKCIFAWRIPLGGTQAYLEHLLYRNHSIYSMIKYHANSNIALAFAMIDNYEPNKPILRQNEILVDFYNSEILKHYLESVLQGYNFARNK